jgi:hypothetical protein
MYALSNQMSSCRPKNIQTHPDMKRKMKSNLSRILHNELTVNNALSVVIFSSRNTEIPTIYCVYLDSKGFLPVLFTGRTRPGFSQKKKAGPANFFRLWPA